METRCLKQDQGTSSLKQSCSETHPSGAMKSANDADGSDPEVQSSRTNRMVTIVTVPEEKTTMPNDSSKEVQPSSNNKWDVISNETQLSSSDKMVEDVTVPDEMTGTRNDSSNLTEQSVVKSVDNMITETGASDVNKLVENAYVSKDTTVPKDHSNETWSSSVNRLNCNGTELQSPNISQMAENATTECERTSAQENSLKQIQAFDVNRVTGVCTEVQSSSVNDISENVFQSDVHVRISTLETSSNVTQPFCLNNSESNNSETQSPNVDMETEDAVTLRERSDVRISTPETSSIETQPFCVNNSESNNSETQSPDVNNETEAAVHVTLREGSDVRISTPETSSNETQPFCLNNNESNNSKTQSADVDIETEAVVHVTLREGSDVTISTPETSSNETQPFCLNSTENNDSEMQFPNVDIEAPITTNDHRQSCILRKTSESTSVMEDLSHESHSNCGDPENKPETDSSVLDKASSSQELHSSIGNNTMDKNQLIASDFGLTDPEEQTDSYVIIPKRMTEKSGTTLKSISSTPMAISNTPPMADFNKPGASCVTTNCMPMSGEGASTVKKHSDIMPLADVKDPSVSCVTLGEIESTLRCVSDAPAEGLKNPAAIVCDMIVETACSYVAMERSKESLLMIDASVKALSESANSHLSEAKFRDSHLSEDMNQPSRKKIKLSKSVNIPLKDLLGGLHTKLCQSNCTSKHNPLVLAVGVPNDCNLRTSLENHLKLSLQNGWISCIAMKDPCSQLRQLVFLMVMLFGKLDLFEFMLKAQLSYSQFFAHSASDLPLMLLFKNMHHFMPSSCFDEKVAVFKKVLKLIAKYSSNVLLVQDEISDDTILHVCAEQIRELTRKIKSEESLVPDSPELQELLDHRKLYDQFCIEMIHTLQKLAVEGPLNTRQVLEFFDVRNKSGETVFEILQNDKLKRSSCNDALSQTSSPASRDGSTEHVMEQITGEEEDLEAKKAEGEAETTVPQTLPTNDMQGNLPAALQSVSMSVNDDHPAGTTALSTNSSSVQMSPECEDQSMPSVSMPSLHFATLQQASRHHTTLQISTATSVGSETDSADEGSSLSQEEGESHLHVSVSPGKYHTFLCSPKCNVKHHELIQLLCATPGHDSLITPVAENESCSNFRTYLKETAWDLNAVVPDNLPKLCYSIIHLSCLLGRYKALEVLSEFGFHPLIHTAITEETPLHMTVRLLQHQPMGSLFLCNAIVSIVKTLNRQSHAISLFAAKDYRGNTVLHSLAKMISPSKSYSETTSIVYLFRVFVHLLLKGQNSSPTVKRQILSGSLKDRNKAGETVEALLQNTVAGEQLWEYLAGLMEGRQASEGASEGCGMSNDDCSQPCPADGDEPQSLIDFVFSQGGNVAKCKACVEGYLMEYQKRLRFLQGRVSSLKEILKPSQKAKSTISRLVRSESIIKSSVEWNKARMQSAIEEQAKQRQQISVISQKLELVRKLKQEIEQGELLQ